MKERNLKIGVDAFSLLYLFREERILFRAYFEGLKLCGDITVVIDKRAAKEKKETVQERKEIRADAHAHASTLTSFTQSPEFEDLDEKSQAVLERLIAERQRAAWCLYPEYMKWFQTLLKELEIAAVWAKEEADTELANGPYDVVISSDSDLLILGARRLWLPRQDGNHGEIVGAEFRRFIRLEGEQLFQMAYLAGCDVQPRSLMSLGQAVSRLRFYGSIHVLHAKHPLIVSAEEVQRYENLKSVWLN